MTVSIISIDIGLKNMAFAYVTIENGNILSIDFELYDLEDYGIQKKSSGAVVNRCTAVKEIFNQAIQNFETTNVIIEKQVPSNESAMCIMYSLYTMAINHLDAEDVCLFDPKMKFTNLNLSYNTRNKAHKKYSVELARKLLKNLGYTELLERFNDHEKRDDIADAINQAIVWSYKNKILEHLTVKDLYEL